MTIPLQAAFIALGMQNPDEGGIKTFKTALEKWGQGMLELVIAGTHYAEYTLKLIEAGYGVIDDFPGVAEYEISEEFGAWFIRQVMHAGELPEHSTCCIKLVGLTFDFFSSAGRHLPQEDCVALHSALVAVPRPDEPQI
jgi:hypothetical protein